MIMKTPFMDQHVSVVSYRQFTMVVSVFETRVCRSVVVLDYLYTLHVFECFILSPPQPSPINHSPITKVEHSK